MSQIETILLPEGVSLPANGIIQARMLETLTKADRIIECAHEQANIIVSNARDKEKYIEKSAYEVGYDHGFKEFVEAVDGLNQKRLALREELQSLLQICLEKILGQIPFEQLIATTLQSVFGELRNDIDVLIMVHPSNLIAIKRVLDHYRQENAFSIHLQIEANEQMTYDACRIYAGPEVIDISIAILVDEMLASLELSPDKEESDATS